MTDTDILTVNLQTTQRWKCVFGHRWNNPREMIKECARCLEEAKADLGGLN